MATYIRHATRALKIVADLSTAQDKALLWSDLVAVSILNKGAGTFTLTFIFQDGTELTLNNTEISNGDVFEWDIKELRITNTAQAGEAVKLIVDQQILKG